NRRREGALPILGILPFQSLIGNYGSEAQKTLSPCGRGWTASEASSPGEGLYWDQGKPLTRFVRCANKPPSPARGEGFQRQCFWCLIHQLQEWLVHPTQRDSRTWN